MCSSRSPKNNTHGFFSCRVHPFSHRCARQIPPFVAARHLPPAGGSQPSRGRQPSQSRLAACQLPRWGSFFAVAASVLALSVKSYGFASSPKGRAFGSPRRLHLFAKASPFGRGGCDQREQTERARTSKFAAAVCRHAPTREKVVPKRRRLRSNESPSGAFKQRSGLR